MHVGKSYKLPELLRWTRRRLYALLVLSAVPVIAWHLGARVPLPWAVAALLGTAASFIVGFKNAQVYNRHMEAQQVWVAIATTSRYWALACRDFPKASDHLQLLVSRHLAWLACLRFFARDPRPWESTARHWNAEYQDRNFRVPEREACLDQELGRYLDEEDRLQLAGQAKSAWSLVARQSATLRAMVDAQELSPTQCIEMQKLDQVGESTENPFEGNANDVPVSHICRAVENALLDLLQRERRPVNEAGSATILI